MITIYKYSLRPFTETEILLPVCSIARGVGMQGTELVVWVEHDLSQPVEVRRFTAVVTGGLVPLGTYVGTASTVLDGYPWVLHVYDTTPVVG